MSETKLIMESTKNRVNVLQHILVYKDQKIVCIIEREKYHFFSCIIFSRS